ncbi:MAG: hypothetical protein DDT37_01960 [Firmicutes bacterium]|nr:hypothetical protein [candidate division NPL-UPA2 bacterium]
MSRDQHGVAVQGILGDPLPHNRPRYGKAELSGEIERFQQQGNNQQIEEQQQGQYKRFCFQRHFSFPVVSLTATKKGGPQILLSGTRLEWSPTE